MNVIEKTLKYYDLNLEVGPPISNEQGLNYSLKNGPEINLSFYNKVDDKFKMSDFTVFLVETKNALEASSFIISLTSQRKVGYVFPIITLSTFEYLPEDEWASVYGSFALQFLVKAPELTKHMKYPELTDTFEFQISDFYSESYAIVILGKQAIIDYGITQSKIKLMLMEQGYYSCEEINISNLYSDLTYPNVEGNKIIIEETSPYIDEELSIKLDWLLTTSLKEANPFSCFLSLYQIIESMSIKVFNACIEVIKENDVIEDPWLLKEKLSSITKEKQRLNLLFNTFLDKGLNQECSSHLQQECSSFLFENMLSSENTGNLVEAFYTVRNTLVHRQVELNPSAYYSIKKINKLVYEICFHILTNLNVEKGKNEFKKSLESKPITEDV